MNEEKSAIEHLRSLHGKKKLQYILDYYGKRILAVCSLFFLSLYVLIHYYTTPDIALNILAVNAGEELEEKNADRESYLVRFLEENGLNPEKNEVHLNQSIYVDANSMDAFNKSSVDMTVTLFTTQAVDLFVSDEDFFKAMAIMGYLSDLREYFSEMELASVDKERLIYTNSYETGEEILAGILLEPECTWLSELGLYGNLPEFPVAAGLSGGMRNPDLAIKMLKEALKEA